MLRWKWLLLLIHNFRRIYNQLYFYIQANRTHAPSSNLGKKVDKRPKLFYLIEDSRKRQFASRPLAKPTQAGILLPVYYLNNYKAFYEGEWNKGQPHGYGKLYFTNGSYFEGLFVNGQITGQDGIYFYPDGSFKRGSAKNGKLQGLGKYVSREGSCILTCLSLHCAVSYLQITRKLSNIGTFSVLHKQFTVLLHISIFEWSYIHFSAWPSICCIIIILFSIYKFALISGSIRIGFNTNSIWLIIDPITITIRSKEDCQEVPMWEYTLDFLYLLFCECFFNIIFLLLKNMIEFNRKFRVQNH